MKETLINRDGLNSNDSLSTYLFLQLENMLPGGNVKEAEAYIDSAVKEVELIIGQLVEWNHNGFDKLVSWQYATFLYKLSRLCIKNNLSKPVTDRLFLLNKTLHGIELYPQVELPKFFFLSYTNSAVFSKANYSDYCVFHQGITIGRNGDKRPTIEKYLVMYPSSMIIGNCHVRENTVLSPGVRLIDKDTPGNCYVFDDGKGGVFFKSIDEIHISRFFNINSEDMHTPE